VRRTDVSLKTKEAVVTFDPAQVTVQQMAEAVDRLGFRAAVKSPPPSAVPPPPR
jgi:copper chaperone CopZ